MSEKENLSALLNNLKKIIYKEELEQREKHKRSEAFNIFSILQLSRNEVRLHSALLAELLNPKGSHGMGSKFLSAFVDKIDSKQSITFGKTDNVKVEAELSIGNISNDLTTGGRIDILISDGTKAIIIENKIDAEDQNKQLLRYWNYGKAKYGEKNFVLFYLTPFGSDPSEISLGIEEKEKTSEEIPIKYQRISYKEFIIQWLERCVEISAERSLVRSTIRQYINLIKQITYTDIMTNQNDLISTLKQSDNIQTTLAILKYQWDFFKSVRADFIELLIKLGEDKGFDVQYMDNSKDKLINLENCAYIKFFPKDLPKIAYLYVGWDKPNTSDGTSYGLKLENTSTEQFNAIQELFKNQPSLWRNNADQYRPLGWSYLWDKNDTGEGHWWDWRGNTNIETYEDMTNGELIKFIETKLFSKEVINAIRKINSNLSSPT